MRKQPHRGCNCAFRYRFLPPGYLRNRCRTQPRRSSETPQLLLEPRKSGTSEPRWAEVSERCKDDAEIQIRAVDAPTLCRARGRFDDGEPGAEPVGFGCQHGNLQAA